MKSISDKYSLDNGRNAVPPIRMFKYLLLNSIFDLSNVDVVERSKYDMSFKYYLNMAPEVVEASRYVESGRTKGEVGLEIITSVANINY